MYNRLLPSSDSKSSFPVLLIPVALFLLNNDFIKSKLNLDQDFTQKTYMLKDIKPYFSVKEQYLLSKIEDALEIFNKIGRIQKETYEDELSTTTQSIPKKERKEEILKNMAKYLDDDNKKIVQKVIDTNKQIEDAKANIVSYNSNKNTLENDDNNIKSIFKLLECFRPLLKESKNAKIKKVDKIIEILNANEENL